MGEPGNSSPSKQRKPTTTGGGSATGAAVPRTTADGDGHLSHAAEGDDQISNGASSTQTGYDSASSSHRLTPPPQAPQSPSSQSQPPPPPPPQPTDRGTAPPAKKKKRNKSGSAAATNTTKHSSNETQRSGSGGSSIIITTASTLSNRKKTGGKESAATGRHSSVIQRGNHLDPIDERKAVIPSSTPRKDTILDNWNNFFFRRTSLEGCRVGGIMRISFAVVFLLERYILSRDLEFLISPSQGMIPSQLDWPPTPTSWSLFHLQHLQDDDWYRQIFEISVVQGVLLLLGILPRLQVLGIFLHLVSLHRHNDIMFDNEDTLLRLWSFFLLFLPLHHLTIYDVFRKVKRRDEYWPMWPFRLFQIQLCAIYASSATSKWLEPHWVDGSAVYWMTHVSTIFPGLLNPDLFFNRFLSLKLICWSILCLESFCWLSVWIEDAKIDVISSMIVLHLSMELTTNSFILNWLMIIGWASFLVQADYMPPLARLRFLKGKLPFKIQPPQVPKGILGLPLKFFIVLLCLMIVTATFPSKLLTDEAYRAHFEEAKVKYLHPLLKTTGIWQDSWNLYKVESHQESSYFQVFIQLRNESILDRRSPPWRSLSFLERKLTARLMKFYANLPSSEVTVLSYARHMVEDIREDVAALDVVRLWERPRAPPSDAEWFAHVRQPLERGSESVVLIRFCVDYNDNCEGLAQSGVCVGSLGEQCRKTCGSCKDPELVWGPGFRRRDTSGATATGATNKDASQGAKHTKGDEKEDDQCVVDRGGETAGRQQSCESSP